MARLRGGRRRAGQSDSFRVTAVAIRRLGCAGDEEESVIALADNDAQKRLRRCSGGAAYVIDELAGGVEDRATGGF